MQICPSAYKLCNPQGFSDAAPQITQGCRCCETCNAEAQRERRSHYYFTILIGKQCDVQVLARRQSGTLPLVQIRPVLQHSMCILRPISAVISSQ